MCVQCIEPSCERCECLTLYRPELRCSAIVAYTHPTHRTHWPTLQPPTLSLVLFTTLTVSKPVLWQLLSKLYLLIAVRSTWEFSADWNIQCNHEELIFILRQLQQSFKIVYQQYAPPSIILRLLCKSMILATRVHTATLGRYYEQLWAGSISCTTDHTWRVGMGLLCYNLTRKFVTKMTSASGDMTCDPQYISPKFIWRAAAGAQCSSVTSYSVLCSMFCTDTANMKLQHH